MNINEVVDLRRGARLVERRRGGKDSSEAVVVIARGRFDGD